MRTQDYLHLYLGCQYRWKDEDGYWRPWQRLTPYQFNDVSGSGVEVQLQLRHLSDMTDEEIIQCGKFICAVPNSTDFKYEIQRYHNSVGAKFFSETYTCGQYLSIYNEKNKAETVGHIEVGWYSSNKIDRRKTKELWKVGGCHEMTIYLISKHFDLFGLINAGLAIDSTKPQTP